MGGGFLSRGSALGAQKIYCVFSAQCSYFTIIYGDHSFHGQNYQMYAGCMGLVFQIGSKPGKMEPQHSIWLDLLQRWSNFELPTTQNRNYEENMGRGGPQNPHPGGDKRRSSCKSETLRVSNGRPSCNARSLVRQIVPKPLKNDPRK